MTFEAGRAIPGRMKNLIDKANDHITNCSDYLLEARNILCESEDSTHFPGNIVKLRERVYEIDSIIQDLVEIQSYIENIDLDLL